MLYLSAGCVNHICIQYQSDGKPVSGSVTPSPSGCNSSFTSENQIHIFEAHRTERAHFFFFSRSMSVSLMCVHANGVIVTRMSHSRPRGSALPSWRGQPRALALPHGLCPPPALGLVLCSLPGHGTPLALCGTWGWESFPFFCWRSELCSESGNSCLETPLCSENVEEESRSCLWGW